MDCAVAGGDGISVIDDMDRRYNRGRAPIMRGAVDATRVDKKDIMVW
eukprot:CAMPEP_0119013304 /NCGR_PEP_ID=MMETSP1176-20130426/8377_1 /TAXON_ID=265551 /ORGANISM="Synedropsis recta cf, Strain CCMP1620" /LENGTH=46 /DNA_ID= /DNA_START= /DNA_END= /DNA_ORIENTATION=